MPRTRRLRIVHGRYRDNMRLTPAIVRRVAGSPRGVDDGVLARFLMEPLYGSLDALATLAQSGRLRAALASFTGRRPGDTATPPPYDLDAAYARATGRERLRAARALVVERRWRDWSPERRRAFTVFFRTKLRGSLDALATLVHADVLSVAFTPSPQTRPFQHATRPVRG